MLVSQGYAVACFRSPREALDALRARGPAGPPALVVTDLMMSSLDAGFTFARTLKAEPGCSGVPVIIVSAVSGQKGYDFAPRTAADLAAMSADAWFDKPVMPAALLAKVKELVR